MAIKRGLGKGLDALFDNSDVMEEEQKDLTEIRINLIEPNRQQPRKHFDEEQLQSLSESIKEHGLIQPIIVAPAEGGFYRIIAGERRWRASRLAGLKVIPALVRNYEDREAAEVTMIENLQREDLNPIEEAEGLQSLLSNFGMTQEQVGAAVGKSRSAVANSIRLLSLPENLINMVRSGLLTGGHARALLSVENETQQQVLAEKIINDQISVREIEKTVSNRKKTVKKGQSKTVSPEISDLEKRLSDSIGTKVKIVQGKSKGKIEIEYYGNDDLSRVLEAICLKIFD